MPVTLDGVSLVAALVALRAELSGEASGVYRVTLFTFTGASAAANWWHGRHAGGTEAALYLGGMSIAVAVVFALALRQIRHEDRRKAGTVTGRLPRFSWVHWVRYPRLTWRAWSLAVRDGHTSPRAALDAVLYPLAASVPTVARDAESAALAAYRASVIGGNPLSGRQLETRFGLSRAQIGRVRATVDGGADAGAERWADICGAPGYQVSDLGNVRRRVRERGSLRVVGVTPLEPFPDRDGYLRVSLPGGDVAVHVLVLGTFRGPCPDGMERLHRNGDEQDNRLRNLRYGTHEENERDKKAKRNRGLKGRKETRGRGKQVPVPRNVFPLFQVGSAWLRRSRGASCR